VLSITAYAQQSPTAVDPRRRRQDPVRYAEKPIERNFFVQVHLDTGEAQLTPESELNLKRLGESAHPRRHLRP